MYIYLSGWPVSEECLDKSAELAGVLQEGNDVLPPAVREECECEKPEVDNVKPRESLNQKCGNPAPNSSKTPTMANTAAKCTAHEHRI